MGAGDESAKDRCTGCGYTRNCMGRIQNTKMESRHSTICDHDPQGGVALASKKRPKRDMARNLAGRYRMLGKVSGTRRVGVEGAESGIQLPEQGGRAGVDPWAGSRRSPLEASTPSRLTHTRRRHEDQRRHGNQQPCTDSLARLRTEQLKTTPHACVEGSGGGEGTERCVGPEKPQSLLGAALGNQGHMDRLSHS